MARSSLSPTLRFNGFLQVSMSGCLRFCVQLHCAALDVLVGDTESGKRYKNCTWQGLKAAALGRHSCSQDQATSELGACHARARKLPRSHHHSMSELMKDEAHHSTLTCAWTNQSWDEGRPMDFLELLDVLRQLHGPLQQPWHVCSLNAESHEKKTLRRAKRRW